jgi:hypothetical protein
MFGRSNPARTRPSSGNSELDEDVGAGLAVAGGGQGQDAALRAGVEQWPKQPVIGPEIMTPFGDAMGLVDRDQGERHLGDERAEALAGRPLGGDVEKIELAARSRARLSRRLESSSAEVSEAARIPKPSADRIWSCIKR